MFANHIYLIHKYIYRERERQTERQRERCEDLALNNLQWFICHKTKPNETQSASVRIWNRSVEHITNDDNPNITRRTDHHGERTYKPSVTPLVTAQMENNCTRKQKGRKQQMADFPFLGQICGRSGLRSCN